MFLFYFTFKINSCVGDGIDLNASNIIVYIIFNSELHVCNVLLFLKQSFR